MPVLTQQRVTRVRSVGLRGRGVQIWFSACWLTRVSILPLPIIAHYWMQSSMATMPLLSSWSLIHVLTRQLARTVLSAALLRMEIFLCCAAYWLTRAWSPQPTVAVASAWQPGTVKQELWTVCLQMHEWIPPP